jgi:aminopeptidase N
MRFTFIIFLGLMLPAMAVEQIEDCLGNCGKAHLFPMGGPAKPGRKYARDRLVDITHLALNVTPNFEARSVAGSMTMNFAPIAQALPKLELDAIELRIEKISVEGANLASWQNTDEQLVLNFAPAIEPGAAVTLRVQYQAQPKTGLLFRTPAMGYPEGDTQCWSQGEAENHRYWFPCYDYPNERFTSEVTCHVPRGMDVISNGSLLGKAEEATGLVSWHWKQSQPHVNYLVAVAAGYFHKVEGAVGKLPLALFVPPSEKDQADLAFLDTKSIIEFFDKEIGVPYPWDKYHQVYCQDFLAGGMENTSCSFMAVSALHPASVGKLDSVHRLNAHELAHQWFGDLLTCRDWSHLWLNEGFASYYTILFEAVKNGRDGQLVSLRKEADRVTSSGDTRPIVWRDYGEPMQQFDSRAYPKGAWVLHMLRSQLGETLYRKAVQTYVERNRNQIVITEDLQKVLEEVSGRSLDRFFDQWVHHGGVPELATEHSWDEKQKLLRVTVKQTQKVDEKVLLFHLPIPLRVQHQVDGKLATEEFTMTVTKAEEQFSFPLSSEPTLVRFDPELTVLAKWNSKPNRKAVEAWLQADFLSRWMAVESLGKEKDDAAVGLLGKALVGDVHFTVRAEAAKSLQSMGTPVARQTLLASMGQEDERVRRAVVDALGAFYHRDVRDALVQALPNEKNPEIMARIISSLAAWPDFDPTPFLKVPSYHNMVAFAAQEVIAQQRRTEAVPQMLELVQQTPWAFKMNQFGQVLLNLGSLAREQKDSPVQPVLLKFLSAPQPAIRQAAASALGELGDPKSITALQAVAKLKGDTAAASAAEAVAKIKARQTAPDQTQAAWKKVEDLTLRAESLEKKLEKLERK